MTAYKESLARGNFQDGRYIWIDKSGVEVRRSQKQTIINLSYAMTSSGKAEQLKSEIERTSDLDS